MILEVPSHLEFNLPGKNLNSELNNNIFFTNLKFIPTKLNIRESFSFTFVDHVIVICF